MTRNNSARAVAAFLCLLIPACSRESMVAPIPYRAANIAWPNGDRLQPGAVTYKRMYSFGHRFDDGEQPFSSLLPFTGAFYGTTVAGGIAMPDCVVGCGTVFRVSLAGYESVIYRFKGATDGASPAGGLIAIGGKLFGTTTRGGNARCSGGCGTVFELNGRLEREIYAFRGGSDGALPFAGLVQVNGNIYGTTEFGGEHSKRCINGCGTIFSLTTNGNERIIYRFKGGADGAVPAAPLANINGVLFGTTEYGGITTQLCSTGCGTVFRASLTGVKTTLHRFNDTTTAIDGAYPAAGVTALNGELYGTTLAGGTDADGTIFKASESSGVAHVIHSFTCCASSSDGRFPLSHLTALNGVLYGTTREGGTANEGTVFSVTPAGSERVLYSFQGKPDGLGPRAGLLLLSKTLYGTTAVGGAYSEGSIFKLTP